MARLFFYIFAVLTPLLVAAWAWVWPPAAWAFALILPLIALGIYDIACKHNVLTNYPVIGHMRYMLEFIRPELRQYFFESDTSGRPFNRVQRDVINSRADGKGDTSPFGTIRDVESAGYDFAKHSLAVKEVDESCGRITFGGPQCSKPYNASRLNISAMSFGSLSANALLARNKGAKLGSFAHDTGEGGLSPYHLEYGADVIWELGTAYFGCRTKEGRFDDQEFKDKASNEHVKMIEIKLSQGAKPVGFKLCLGKRSEFMSICKAMIATGICPDFITIDGAEGGTGAAPVEFSDRLGTYINEARPFVHNCLVGANLRDDIRIVASGKVAMGFDMVVKHALGADACNAARPFMFAVGCIQARRCHTNTCPTGVATQDPARARAVDVAGKSLRVKNFHAATHSQGFSGYYRCAGLCPSR